MASEERGKKQWHYWKRYLEVEILFGLQGVQERMQKAGVLQARAVVVTPNSSVWPGNSLLLSSAKGMLRGVGCSSIGLRT